MTPSRVRRLAATVGLLFAGGVLGVGACAPEPEVAPNILWIVWDTVRADRLSAYGYAKPTTPHLEEFAAEAQLFERAVSPGMWTLPSHGSLFTGLPVTTPGLKPW